MNKQNFTIVSFILVFVVLCTIEAVPARGCNTTVIANDLPDVEPIKYRDEYSFIGRISDNLPKLEITVADTGIYSGNSQRENVLSVTITAQDNSFSHQSRNNHRPNRASESYPRNGFRQSLHKFRSSVCH